MSYRPEESKTPWQRVVAKFGMSPSAFSKEIGRDRSKLSRVLRDERGLINGDDQERILEAAKRLGVNITPADLVPDHR